MNFGTEIHYIANPFANWFGPDYINLGIWAIPVTLVWIVGITNAVNLIDGLDGLAVGVSSIALFVPNYVLKFVNTCICAFDYNFFIVSGITIGGFAIIYYAVVLLSSDLSCYLTQKHLCFFIKTVNHKGIYIAVYNMMNMPSSA